MDQVLFLEQPLNDGRYLLEVILNAEKSLNALNLEMIRMIRPRLEQARSDDRIALVLLRGAGDKAFCAGGDVVKLYHALKAGEGRAAIEPYFIEEYSLDYLLHCFPKPVICWASGVVMGGGMGLMNGCSHRIVSETTRLAMPEISIGLYPDVGASWFLNHTCPELGLFLALSAYRMNAADARYMQLADWALESTALPHVLAALLQADWRACPAGHEHALVSQVLKACTQNCAVPATQGWLAQQHEQISALCSADSAAEVVSNLLAFTCEDKIWSHCQRTLQAGSPLAAQLIFTQLKNSRHLSLREVFAAEMLLTTNCCMQPGLAEGIRALLVDKDQQPNWQFKSVDTVDLDYVAQFFQSPWEVNPIQAELLSIEA